MATVTTVWRMLCGWDAKSQQHVRHHGMGMEAVPNAYIKNFLTVSHHDMLMYVMYCIACVYMIGRISMLRTQLWFVMILAHTSNKLQHMFNDMSIYVYI